MDGMQLRGYNLSNKLKANLSSQSSNLFSRMAPRPGYLLLDFAIVYTDIILPYSKFRTSLETNPILLYTYLHESYTIIYIFTRILYYYIHIYTNPILLNTYLHESYTIIYIFTRILYYYIHIYTNPILLYTYLHESYTIIYIFTRIL